MNRERGYSPETPENEKSEKRTLEGDERERMVEDLTAFIEGLEAALADPDMPAEEREEMEEELRQLKDSQEGADEGGAFRV